MIHKLDGTFRFYEDAANLRAQRQQLIASNIANADTPHFKARDFNFKAALEGAASSRSVELTTTSAHHVASSRGGPADNEQLLYRTAVQGSVDGNTVDMDVERSQFADNAIHYEANLTFISDQIRIMRAAIQG
jgi:flagellar basal-body rod protein FlgB